MKDKLTIQELRAGAYGYCIQWKLADDGELGAVVGEGIGDNLDIERATAANEKCSSEEREDAVVTLAAAEMKPEFRQGLGFYWDRLAEAQAALHACNAALKAFRLSSKPMPEWALTAAAAGWKPPKGWKP